MAGSNSVSGFAVRYNEPTTIAGAFIERIAPGAFKDLGDVTLLWGHDHSQPLARTTAGTLKLRDSRIGLWFEADLDVDNPDAARAISAISRLDVRGMSFGFRVKKEEWREPDNYDELPERTILEAEISEVSAVTWPAYPQSDVSLARTNAANASRRRAEAAMRKRGLPC
jgi:HK97 family phage prohead protease